MAKGVVLLSRSSGGGCGAAWLTALLAHTLATWSGRE